MKSIVNSYPPGMMQSSVRNKPQINEFHAEKGAFHFVTEFAYQMLMIRNDDDQAQVEVTSTFNRNQKGYKILYPPENSKNYKLFVEPDTEKVILIQN